MIGNTISRRLDKGERKKTRLPNAHQAAIHNAWTYRSNHWKKPLAYDGRLDRSKNGLVQYWGVRLQPCLQLTEENEGYPLKPAQKLLLQ